MLKKVFLFNATLAVALLVGCKKDNEKIPELPSASINLGEVNGSIKVLETIDFALEASFPSGLKSGQSIIWLDDLPLDTVFESGKDSLLFSVSENHSFEVAPKYSGGNIKFTFSVTDLLDQVSGDTVAVAIEESAIQLIDSKTIAGFNNSSIGSFLDIESDTAYFSSNIQSSTSLKQSVDFVFFFTKNDKRILASPSNTHAENVWGAQSSALWPLFGSESVNKLYDLGANVDYDGIITGAQITSMLATQTTAVDSLTNLEAGRFVGFELEAGGKLGIIKVTDIGGNSESTATITFDAKIQR
ncbi:MAG: hypothetical protein JXR03_07495 [Cyclobacteriaceae bacterium]